MGEYICPITKELCLRPGEPLPGGTDMSDEGYCGGEQPDVHVCSIIIDVVRLKLPSLPQPTYMIPSPTTVCIYEYDNPENRLYKIVSGKVTKNMIYLPDFTQTNK